MFLIRIELHSGEWSTLVAVLPALKNNDLQELQPVATGKSDLPDLLETWLRLWLEKPNERAFGIGHPGKAFLRTGWQDVTFDLSTFSGKKIRLWFGTHQDGYGDQTANYIDRVKILCR